MIKWVQVDGIQGYDKDQIALVILDLSDFMAQVPLILGTPTISGIVNVIKIEGDWHLGDALDKCLSGSSVSIKGCSHHERWPNSWELKLGQIQWNGPHQEHWDHQCLFINVITAKANTAHTGKRIKEMTQALCVEDSSLPQGLTVQNAYTKLRKGSKNVIVVVRHSTSYPWTLRKKTSVARAVEVTQVPEPLAQIGSMWVMGEVEDNSHQMPKLTMKQRQEKLFEELDLSRLKSWPPELPASTQSLLAKYHDVFSIEPSKLGCTHSTNMSLKLLMTSQSRNDSGGYLHPHRGGL